MRLTIYKITLLCGLILVFASFVFAQAEREKGIELYEQGDYKAAVEVFQKVVEADEKDGESWRFLGMAYARMGNNIQTHKAFDKADDFPDKELNKNYDVPVKITKLYKNKYTKEAGKNYVTGTVKLAVEFGRDGKIGYIFPVKELPYGLTESSIKAATKIKFEPAVRDDKNVTVIMFIEYNFAID